MAILPDSSYWSGRPGGGRQGLMLAQRYPTLYDGIAAAALVVNWPQFFVAEYLPQHLMNELNSYPHPCEFDALTLAAIDACDGLDGVVDTDMARPDLCRFDLMTMIGKPSTAAVTARPPRSLRLRLSLPRRHGQVGETSMTISCGKDLDTQPTLREQLSALTPKRTLAKRRLQRGTLGAPR